MTSEHHWRQLFDLMRELAGATEGPSARRKQAALKLYSLADRLGARQAELARRLRREARRFGSVEPVEGATAVATDQVMPPLPSRPPVVALPPRHARVLRHLLDGASEKQVAQKLGLSRHTVHEYVKKIYRQLGVGSRAELLALRLVSSAPPYLGTSRIRDPGNGKTEWHTPRPSRQTPREECDWTAPADQGQSGEL